MLTNNLAVHICVKAEAGGNDWGLQCQDAGRKHEHDIKSRLARPDECTGKLRESS